MLLLLGLRNDADKIVLAWPKQPQSALISQSNMISLALGWTAVVVLWGLTAFRSAAIGNDTSVYIDYFRIFAEGGIDTRRSFELGYQALNVLIGLFTRDPHVFLICIATIMYAGTFFYIRKYSRNFLVSLCLFFCFFFSTYTSIFRQGIAMVIVLYAYQAMKQKKTVLALVLIIIAFFFHSTAAVALLLLFHDRLLTNAKIVYFLAAAALIVSQTGILYKTVSVVAPRYLHYFTSRYASSGWLAVAYEAIRALLMFVLVSKAASKKEKDRLCVMNFALILIFSSLGFAVNLFTRASMYYLLIAVTEFPNMLYEKQLPNRRWWLLEVGAVSLAMFLLILIFRPGWNHLYPYSFWR